MIKVAKELQKLGIKVNHIIGNDVLITKTNKLDNLKNEIVNKVNKNWSTDKIKANPILNESQKLHRIVLGEKGNKYISSPEFLISYILKNKRFISINDIVDCYNLASIKQLIAIGSHDLDKVDGKLKIDICDGSERFIPLGMTKNFKIPKNAYAFFDDKDILCFLESRQCEKTKITPHTTNFITYLQGNSQTSKEYVNKATQDLLQWYKHFCQGNFVMYMTDNKEAG